VYKHPQHQKQTPSLYTDENIRHHGSEINLQSDSSGKAQQSKLIEVLF
jgi:chromosome segregation ATPase